MPVALSILLKIAVVVTEMLIKLLSAGKPSAQQEADQLPPSTSFWDRSRSALILRLLKLLKQKVSAATTIGIFMNPY